jgi:CubicO group peptidase (beta-lactamase class C family)
VVSKGFNLLSPPGKAFNYSNTGYELLGLIIEKVSGKTYEDYVQKNIFDKLEMVNSGFGYNRNINAKLAKSYDTSGGLITKDAYIDSSLWPFSAGEICSTIGDLYKWDRALYTEKLVSKKTLNKIFTPVLNYYGYGWNISTPGYMGDNWHDGSVFGFTSTEKRIGIKDTYYIILSNKEKTYFGSIIQALSQELPK